MAAAFSFSLSLSRPAPLLPFRLHHSSSLRHNPCCRLIFPSTALTPTLPRPLRSLPPRRRSASVVASAQSNLLRVIQTAFRIGKDGIDAGTNLIPDSVPRPVARISVAVAAVTVGLFLLKSLVSTAFFVLAMMGFIYFAFIAFNKDEGPKGSGGSNSGPSSDEEAIEEVRRIMDKYNNDDDGIVASKRSLRKIIANETSPLAAATAAQRSGPMSVAGEVPVDDPELVASTVQMSISNNTQRRELGYLSCGTGNPIDDCWRCDPNWHDNRKRLADCGIGFGRNAIGGRNGRYYVVTDPNDDDAVNPRPGTLRHAVIQDEPLWIIFKRDMVITLKQELIMNSFKTIDGRGANVHIANGACITIQFISNVIIHGINIHDCKRTGNAMVRSSPSHYGWRTMADGDAISIFGSSHVWVDHCSLSNCPDGLIDAIMGSTAITISNNYFTHHNEVMLLGHSDSYHRDKIMQVTIAFNHFGEGLIQRMPRCRHGYFHVVNNDYTHWEMYAIGGSADPTINSQGNRYLAPANPFAKEVTKRVLTDQGVWKGWNWRSVGDLMLNGAYFTPSGAGAAESYARASSLAAKPSSLVGPLTSSAGVLRCHSGNRC